MVTVSACGDLTELLKHLKSVRTNPNRNSKVCVACGKDCYHCCFECVGPDGKKGVAMHVRPCSKKGKDGEIPCFYHYHDTNSFGLARNDWKRSEKTKRKKEWTQPTDADRRAHAKKIKRLMEADDCLVAASVTPQTPQERAMEILRQNPMVNPNNIV